MAHVSNKLSNPLEGALAGGGDPATSPLYVFGPFLRLIVVAGVAQITFGASVWLVVLTIALVSAMYRLVMIWIVDGSGGSGLSEEEFGGWAVKLNASITFVEYTLTFLVSMAALVTFIADRVPALNEPFLGFQYRTFVAIALSIGTGWLVNRGPRVAARAFGPATGGVLLLLWAMILSTLIKYGVNLPSIRLEAFSPENIRFTLGGYVRILAVMTGIEIFANLVAAYEGEPKRKSRMAFQSLVIIMGTTIITMLIVGPAILSLSDPTNTEVSVFTQTMDQLLPTPLAFLGTFVSILVLLSASAASAQGLQNLALGLRMRHYVPAIVGQRNAFDVASVPVWIEVGIVSLCFLIAGTNEETYLAIYAAGVFILLSMTGWAASRRLLRQFRNISNLRNLATLGGTLLAAILTTVATIIIFSERFTEGAWTYFVFLPLLYVLFSYFRRKLGKPMPANERHGLLQAGQRYLPVSDLGYTYLEHNFDNILVPLDGSEFAEEAIPLAKAISPIGDNRLTLLSVVQTSGAPRTVPLVTSSLDGDYEAHEDYLQKMSKHLDGLGLKSRLVIGQGSVPEEIVATAKDYQANLLVMSTHGRSGIGRLLVGSVASQVIRTSSLPIVLVKPGTREQSESHLFGKLLVALDGSTVAEQVLPFTQAMASHFESEVILLSVPGDLSAENQTDVLSRYLADVAEWLKKDGLAVETNVIGSTPAHTIVSLADSHGADLIMLASRGLGGSDRLMFGSVADTVIRNANRPVFLVPVHPT